MVIELHILLVLMIVGALVAVEAHDLLSSVVSVSAVGLGLSMAFLILKAPDVAITQMVVEILCLILLIRATIRKDLPFSTSGRWWVNTLMTGGFVVAVVAGAVRAFRALPPFGEPLMGTARVVLSQGQQQTGATNMVASILLDYRAFDRLGEGAIVFLTAIAALTLLRFSGRHDPSVEEDKE